MGLGLTDPKTDCLEEIRQEVSPLSEGQFLSEECLIAQKSSSLWTPAEEFYAVFHCQTQHTITVRLYKGKHSWWFWTM